MTAAMDLTPEGARQLPVRVPLDIARRYLGIGRARAYALAQTDDFPVKVLPRSRPISVRRSELLRLLDIPDYPYRDATVANKEEDPT
jgi:hypothetical protein